MIFFVVVLAVVVILSASSQAEAKAAPVAKGRTVIEPFGYLGVSLDSGSMRKQFDETRDYYLRIPNDDLLLGFRRRAGLPAPGVELGGWYSGDVFNAFGQIVSGLSRMHAATGDAACRDKVDTLLSEWGKCIGSDGFFFYSDHCNAPHYFYDKVVCGLVDAYLFCGNKDALEHLSRITDWAIKNLDRTNTYAFIFGPSSEWYTLSENLYRAYLASGDPKYREFARVWEYTAYWGHYAEGASIFSDSRATGGYHAYSHINTLSGAAAAYRVTGEKRYLDTVRNAYDFMQDTQCYATGGYGPDERLLPADQQALRLETSVNHFETQCGSWAAFKLSKYLMSFTGDARYGDWVERLVINGIGASVPSSADGKVFYYADYNTAGGSKRMHSDSYPCCAGTTPQAIADYYDLIYFKDARSLYVNLFTPSTVNWSVEGNPLRVEQVTRFPEADTVTFVVSSSRPVRFALKVRVPGWLARPMTAAVNGRKLEVEADALHWAVFDREWEDGDHLEVTFPMAFASCRFPRCSDKEYPAAIAYGPVVMALRSPDGNPSGLVDIHKLDSAFEPAPGEPLTYHLASDPDVLVRPFYAFKEGQPYYLYLNPSSSAWTRKMHTAVEFGPEWGAAVDLRMSNQPGAVAKFDFEGTGIRWFGYLFDDAGKAQVRIDGELVETVDQYGPGRHLPFKWERTGLRPGKHSITLTVTEEKNPASTDHYVNVTRLDVLPG